MFDDTTERIEVQEVKNPVIYGSMPVTARIQNDTFADYMGTARKPKQNSRRIDRDRYVVNSTGEVKTYNRRADSMRHESSLRRTFDHLRWTIRHNFTGGYNEIFGTLTYAENMRDKERLHVDFKAFIKELKRKFPEHKLEYIAVDEPQARGAWHVHFLLKSDKPVLYIDNDKLAKIWRHGFTKVKRLRGVTDIGTYFVSYFTDIIVNEDGTEATEEQIAAMSDMVKSKKRKKMERLKYYPPGARFYHSSKGIKEPPPVDTTLGELGRLGYKDVYVGQYNVVKKAEGCEDQIINTITRGSMRRRSKGLPTK